MNRKFLKLSLQIVLIVVVLALYLSFQIYVLNVNYQVHNLQQKLALINRQNETLQLQLSKMSDTQYLEVYAKTKLNMKSPEKVEYIAP
jgi:cell division protein FtsB